MKENYVNPRVSLRVNINDVEVSDLSKTIYDYSNREDEISALVESIGSIGQQQPITVLRLTQNYFILDGCPSSQSNETFKFQRN